VLELPAPGDGVLAEIRKGDGATVAGQEVIAVIDTDAKPSTGAAPSAQPAAVPAAAPEPASETAPARLVTPPAAGGAEVTALPSARKLMEERGLSSADVQGTGRGGRITKGDVLGASAPQAARAPSAKTAPAPEPRAPEQRAPAQPSQPAPAPQTRAPMALGARPEQRVPMSRLRQRVAERLVQSQSTAAILTTFNEVNMQPVIELRNRYKERFEKDHGVKLGFMGFFVKAAVHALKKFPIVNASIDGTDVVYHGYYDIGIAVGSPRGL